MVGPVPIGVSKFVMEAPSPNPTMIPRKDILGVTVLLLSVLYMDQEFVRVGYYVNNEFTDEALGEAYASDTPPETIDYSKLTRNILAGKPKVTRFPIKWEPTEVIAPPTSKIDVPSSTEVQTSMEI